MASPSGVKLKVGVFPLLRTVLPLASGENRLTGVGGKPYGQGRLCPRTWAHARAPEGVLYELRGYVLSSVGMEGSHTRHETESAGDVSRIKEGGL